MQSIKQRKTNRAVAKKPRSVSLKAPARRLPGKTKVSVSVATELIDLVDDYVKTESVENPTINRSTVMEESLKLWRAKRIEAEEEAYYAEAAGELNRDAESWIAIANESVRRVWG